MKLKPLTVVFVLLVTLGPYVTTIHAQSNNTLVWGVEEGEEFTYVLQRAYYADPNYRDVIAADFPFLEGLDAGQSAIMTVESLDPIPDQIDDPSQMPISLCGLVRTNDSVSLGTTIPNFVLPIGDWEFLTDKVNLTGLSGVTLINTQEEYGFKGAGSFRSGDGSIVTITLEIRFEKENGTLNYLRERYSTLGTDLIDIIFVNWHPGMPTIVSAGLQLGTVLIITVGAVTVLIVSSLVYLGYKRKKPLVQKLGE